MPASPEPEPFGGSKGRNLSAVVAIFGSVGVAATLCYLLIVSGLTALSGLSPAKASVVAYLICTILSYYGHKHLSFASKRADAVAVPRFLASAVIGLAMAWLVPAVGDDLGWPAAVSFVLICVLVPGLNFVLLSRWVFLDDTAGNGLATDRHALLLVVPVVLLIAVTAYGVNAWRWGTIPDTSWLITVIERMSKGERLYSDLIELNPPFSVWLYVPPVRFALALGLASEGFVRAYTLLLCLMGTGMAGWMLAASGALNRRSATTTAIVLFAVTTLLSGNGFSERDQIGAVLALPLLILSAWRAQSRPARRPSLRYWLPAGLGAAVLAIVRPYYVVVVLAAACFVAFRRRDLRVLLLPEFVLSGLATVLYLAAALALYPPYFETLLPLLNETYMAYRQPAGLLLLTALPWLALMLVYMLRRRLLDRPEPSDFLMVAALAAWVPYFLQGKGWPYQSYPATLFGSAALVVALAILFEKRRSEPRLGYCAVALAAILLAHVRFAATEKPDEHLVAAATQPGENPSVGMLGSGIERGHPFARMIGGRWIEPYCSDWLAAYVAHRKETLIGAGDKTGAARFMAMETDYLIAKRARLQAAPPDVLVVDRNDALVSYMLRDFGFQSVLDGYDRVAEQGSVELYRLRAGVPTGRHVIQSSPFSASD